MPADALAESTYSLGNSNPNILMQTPTSEEIANYFGLINPLKYSQPTQPQQLPNAPPLGTLTVTAYSAGHTLGGTIWHIQHGMESVVYAVDWNQARERALSGAAWFGEIGGEVIKELRRPTAMICSSKGTGLQKAVGLDQRDEALMTLIRDTIANGGSVLIPSDSSARILELAHLLEEAWKTNSQLNTAKVYLASRTAGATMRYARSMLEWMEKGIENDSFDFKHITLLERRSRVTKMLAQTEPRVILASDTSLEWGFSKDAIRSLAADSRNLIVLTERIGDCGNSNKGLGRFLWELWNEKNPQTEQDIASTASIDSAGIQASLRSARAVPLDGQELPLYQQYLARQRQLQTTMQGDSGTALETSGAAGDDWSASTSTTSEDSDDEHQGRLLNTATILRHTRKKLGLSDEELGVKILIQRKNVYDWDVRAKRGEEKVFPFVAKQRRTDDFGEVIRPEEFARADEEDQVATEALRDGAKKENEVGQKRKWEDLTIQTREGGRQKKNRKADTDGQGPKDGDDASDSEPEDDSERIDGPSKVIFETESLQLHCRVAFVDFSALHDLRIINNLLPLIQPRKLIFVAGDETETEKLAEEARTVLAARTGEASNTADVFTPLLGDTIDASVDTNAWSVKLSRNMVRKLQWQKVRGLGVVAITGRLAAASLEPSPEDAEDTPAKKKAKLEVSSTAENDKMDTTPILDVVPANFSTAVRTVAQPFHVGDLRLPDLRKFLQAAGMTAEFGGGGVLVINGDVSVTINKLTNRVEVDGGAYNLADRKSDGVTFYKVKKKIYEGLAVVAGN